MVKEKVKAKSIPKKKAVPKKKIKKTVKIETKKATLPASPRYIESLGRRKTAVARIRLFPKGEERFLVNKKDYRQYFSTPFLQRLASEALSKTDLVEKLGLEIIVRGGGIKAQAEAVRLGISRALVELSPEAYKKLRKLGYLTRDPRMRERKKFGLKRARKAPQWQKR
ncbi:MAG: 30S ribosomal protein S9 [bacterium]|nr:30S ribosomal protein S9 [bacterium]